MFKSQGIYHAHAHSTHARTTVHTVLARSHDVNKKNIAKANVYIFSIFVDKMFEISSVKMLLIIALLAADSVMRKTHKPLSYNLHHCGLAEHLVVCFHTLCMSQGICQLPLHCNVSANNKYCSVLKPENYFPGFFNF